MKPCPYCAESIQDAAVVCPRCRSKVLPFWKRRGVRTVAVIVALLAAWWFTDLYNDPEFQAMLRASRGETVPDGSATAPLAQMAAEDRHAVLALRLTDRGYSCPGVTRAELRGMPDGLDSAVWAVDCGAGRYYALFLTAEGTRIVDCPEARRLGLRCFDSRAVHPRAFFRRAPVRGCGVPLPRMPPNRLPAGARAEIKQSKGRAPARGWSLSPLPAPPTAFSRHLIAPILEPPLAREDRANA